MRSNGQILPDVFIRTNVDAVLKTLDDVAMRQVPFALSLALNRTAEEGRDAVIQHIHQHGFTIRSSTSGAWLDKHAFVPPQMRASKRMLRVQLRVSPPGLKTGRYSAEPWLDQGGVREGTRPIGRGGLFDRAVAIPYRKGAPMTIIPRALYPVNLGLTPRRTIEGGWDFSARKKGSRRQILSNYRKFTLRGLERTFVVTDRAKGAGAGMLFQRTGPGRNDIRPLFTIRRQITVQGRDYFLPTAQRTFRDRLATNTLGFLTYALRTSIAR
jgi:hypothetical protein